jgi:AraC-like DNA-binding protein
MDRDPGFERHESPGIGSLDALARAPHPSLRPFAGTYQGYRDNTPGELERREIPIGRVVFVASFGEPYRMTNARSGDVTCASSFVAGMHDTHVANRQPGPTAGVQVNLTPIGAHLLLARPMDEIANRTVPLDELLGDGGRSLAARLGDAPDWQSRFAILDEALLERLARARPASRGVVWAWQRLEETRGCVPIGSLASSLGWSRKRLVAGFRQQVGLAPKTVARILRFNHAVRLINRGAELPWTAIAARAGYYDQAHFIRDFSEFTGMTPTEFVATR